MSPICPGSGKLYRMLQPLILASASPRRSEMLGLMGLEFQVIPSGAEENGGVGRGILAQVEAWAKEKAAAVSKLNPNAWVLGADTVVVLDGKIFGKPADASEAREMLKELSGRTHEVLSGVCLIHDESSLSIVQSVRTLVHFRDLHAREIDAYVKTGEPLDKAGAYGIQGLGAFLVRAVSGSYTNVVGLPLWETLSWLLEYGVIEPAD